MAEVKAKKSLGQNFLKDENILRKIADSFKVNANDLIIEIGPGMGALTKYLIQKPSSLFCYEIDERMKDILLSFKSEKVEIIFDDFLRRDLQKDLKQDFEHIYVIANIPYYITTPIIEHLLESAMPISGMTLLVQKEVALRFCASPKTKDYGYFTVFLQHFFEIHKLFDVSPNAFVPKPKVTSSVVQFVRKEKIYDLDVSSFCSFLKQCFQYKRKTLRNNLQQYDWSKIQNILDKYGFSLNVRAEELSYEIFVLLFKSLFN